jgi:hypothetical protein
MDLTMVPPERAPPCIPLRSARFALAPLGTDPAQPIAGKDDHPDGDGNDQAGDDDRSVPHSGLGMCPQQFVR